MKIADYVRQVFVPGNVAVSALRRAGLPIDIKRLEVTRDRLVRDMREYEKLVEGEAAKRGINLKYSEAHTAPEGPLVELLFGAKGVCGEPKHMTASGKRPSTEQETLAEYASLSMHREDDNPVAYAVMRVRSLQRGVSTYLNAFERTRRADGACHPKFNWAVVRTARLSAEEPPVHQLPEKADPEVAYAIKSVIVPRVRPAPSPEDWDPRKHGSCFRWDIVGAEAAIRAAMMTKLFCHQPSPLWEYLRLGRDPHARNAALIMNTAEFKPDGTPTWPKGSIERDAAGKQTFFAKLFGGTWVTVQATVKREARLDWTDEWAQTVSDRFDDGDPALVELYQLDGHQLGTHGWVQDAYGRRRFIGLPPDTSYRGVGPDGKCQWEYRSPIPARRRALQRLLDRRWHQAANTPTQSTNASDTLWMLALSYLGEYVELRVPPLWEGRGLLYPEAKGWRLHGGPGPGGRPFQAWHTNTVHDSGWGDCAPGYLEPLAKVMMRRCTALPLDWRLKADVPYRIELKVGPDQANMIDYNKVAKRFGLELMNELKA